MLLAYLLLGRGKRHSRDNLAGVFWPELSQDRARSALNTALWRLRRIVESACPRGTYLQTAATGDVAFNCASDYWLDVEAFEGQVEALIVRPPEALGHEEAERLAPVLRLYVGDLLESCPDDWIVPERERLRRLYTEGMAHLMRYRRLSGAYDEALAWGMRILDMDPLREDIHREMMQLYVQSGQRPLAVRQYELCRRVLDAELGIPPMDETQALYAHIVPLPVTPAAPPSPSPPPAEVQKALGFVEDAVRNLERAKFRLHRATQELEQLSGAQATGSDHTGHDLIDLNGTEADTPIRPVSNPA
jgi:DNA-binding SARP family transcriptional activator